MGDYGRQQDLRLAEIFQRQLNRLEERDLTHPFPFPVAQEWITREASAEVATQVVRHKILRPLVAKPGELTMSKL